jgi:non-specific serine/threonine protein kinase
LFWPDSTEANARTYLRKALWQVRKSLGLDPLGGEDYLLADDISISINPKADYWLDAAALSSKPTEGEPLEDLTDAVSAYQGELLPGFYEQWVALERERLRATFEQRMETLLGRLADEECWADVLDWGERWIALGSMPEPAYRSLMVAHAALGNIGKVAAVYERCVQSLRDELGVEPSEQTKLLYQQLRKGETGTGLPPTALTVLETTLPDIEDSAAKRPADRRSANVPIPLTSFIGREEEIAEIRRQLFTSRLLTLTGAGGSGKTRLAIRMANEVLSEFSDGLRWVELSTLVDQSLVPQAVAKVLGVRETPNQTLSETLANSLRPRELLLVLDGCEHLVDACAQLAEYLLQECPGLRILATSREVMGVAGEHVFRVPTLSSPDPSRVPLSDYAAYDAVQLFVERAASLKPDFALTDQNAPAVGQVCRGLDGIPLAIELAAARVQALRVEQIAARLDDRFWLLTSGSRTALPRHQTLRAAIDWSYELLSEAERIILQRLSVFAGGWTVAAAEAVCVGGGFQPDNILDLLSQLANKSLVLSERSPGEQARYRMLNTIREYAGEKLAKAGEEASVRDRHLEYFAASAEEAEPQLFSPEQVLWLNRLEAQHDDFRAAAVWSLERKAANSALRLVGALSWFWSTRGHYREARELSLQILTSPMARVRTEARAKALNNSGAVQWVLGGQADIRPMLEEALDIATEIGDRLNTAWAHVYLGTVIFSQGKSKEGLSLLESGLAECRALGSAGKHGVGFSLAFLGDGAFHQGDYQRALELYEKSVDVLSELQDLNFLAYPYRRLGHAARYLGDFARAAEGCKESLSLNLQLGHKQAVAACISGLACVALAHGKALAAARLFGAVEEQLDTIGFSLLPSDAVEYERSVALARAELDEPGFSEAWAEGQIMTTEQAIDLALQYGAQGE